MAKRIMREGGCGIYAAAKDVVTAAGEPYWFTIKDDGDIVKISPSSFLELEEGEGWVYVPNLKRHSLPLEKGEERALLVFPWVEDPKCVLDTSPVMDGGEEALQTLLIEGGDISDPPTLEAELQRAIEAL